MANHTISWKRLPIVELCEAHVDCVNRTAPVVSGPTPYKMLRTTNVRNGYVDADHVRYVTEETFKKWTRRLVPKRGDIILTREAPLGDVGKIRTDDHVFLGQRLYHFRPDPSVLNADYLLYALLGVDLQSQIRGFGSGSTVEHMRLEDIPSLEFNVPPLPVQQRIAGILSAYDDLIENSQRRIKILESMARALYREWFVNFRFPGHEGLLRVASPLGEIPKGWEVKKLADLCESVSYGYTASASREEVGPKFLRITDIVPDHINWVGVPYCQIPEDKASKYLLRPGDIVVARTGATTGYAKRLNKRHPETVFASYLVRVRAGAGVSNRMLGILMESDSSKQFVNTNIGGAAQPQANAVVLTSMRVAAPTPSVADKFDQLVEPLLDECELLAAKIQNLRHTRDLLLPRLLSGQIDVEVA